jgi:hypothetical protein
MKRRGGQPPRPGDEIKPGRPVATHP